MPNLPLKTLSPQVYHQDPLTAQSAAAAFARKMLEPSRRTLIVDTETTGLRGNVWELAAVGTQGHPELLWLGNPGTPWEEHARTMHAARLSDIEQAPKADTFALATLHTFAKRPVLAYNAEFDQGRLEASFARELPTPLLCIAELYAPFAETWSERRSTWRTPSLKDACAAEKITYTDHHTALADAQAAAALLRAIASKPVGR